MKKPVTFFILFSLVFLVGNNAFSDPMDELIEKFGQEYEDLKPPSPNSSINADYKLGQAALGSFYTAKTIRLLYGQNRDILAKYDDMIAKYDEIIEQNKEIIRILSVIAKKGDRTENNPIMMK